MPQIPPLVPLSYRYRVTYLVSCKADGSPVFRDVDCAGRDVLARVLHSLLDRGCVPTVFRLPLVEVSL